MMSKGNWRFALKMWYLSPRRVIPITKKSAWLRRHFTKITFICSNLFWGNIRSSFLWSRTFDLLHHSIFYLFGKTFFLSQCTLFSPYFSVFAVVRDHSLRIRQPLKRSLKLFFSFLLVWIAFTFLSYLHSSLAQLLFSRIVLMISSFDNTPDCRQSCLPFWNNIIVGTPLTR